MLRENATSLVPAPSPVSLDAEGGARVPNESLHVPGLVVA